MSRDQRGYGILNANIIRIIIDLYKKILNYPELF